MTEPSTPDAGRQTMSERYGERSPRTGPVVATVVLGLLGLSWLMWTAWTYANPDVQGEIQSYDVVSDHAVTVVIDVRRASGDAVECTVRARAADHAVVGEDVVTIPAGEAGGVTQEVTVRTEREATSATVENCHPAAGPS